MRGVALACLGTVFSLQKTKKNKKSQIHMQGSDRKLQTLLKKSDNDDINILQYIEVECKYYSLKLHKYTVAGYKMMP